MMQVKVKATFSDTNQAINDITGALRKTLKTGINKALRQYDSKNSWIGEVIKQDIVSEYVQTLISYDYSGAKEREEMTELIMRADGKDPNPQGSYKKPDAVTWARKSTKVEIKTSVRKRSRPRPHILDIGKLTKYATHSDTLFFKIKGIVNNRILASLEEGRVSWVGDPNKIANMIRIIANKGFEAERINIEERDRIREYARKPNLFRRETEKRKYFEVAVEKATEKYKHKWIGIVKKDLVKHIKSIPLPKIRAVISNDNTRVTVKGHEELWRLANFNEWMKLEEESAMREESLRFYKITKKRKKK